MSPNKKIFFGFDLSRIVSVILYLGLAISLFNYYKFQINPDGISYIKIAEKYLLLDFPDAVNGYWGPLMSWLLLPFLAVGLDPLIAARVLLVTIGAFTLIQADSLIKLLQIKDALRCLVLCIVAIIITGYSSGVITPDLLFTGLALALVSSLIKSSYANDRFAGVKCGALGAALYLSKSYGFPFFLANFFIFNLIFLIIKWKNREDLSLIIINTISGLLIFLIITLPWIAMISSKYGMPTIGTAGGYNHSIVGPSSLGHPMHYVGLLDPSDKYATSVWEDPSYLKVSKWSMTQSSESFRHQMELLSKNIIIIYNIMKLYSFLTLPLFALAAFLIFKGLKQHFQIELFLLLIYTTILFAGYALVLVENRYLWLSNIIAVIIGATIMDQMFKKFRFKIILQVVLSIAFAFSFLISPVQEMRSRIDAGKDFYKISQVLEPFGINGRIASNAQWHATLYLSFINGWKYFGEKGHLTKDNLYTQLKEKQIDYYFLWGNQYNDELQFLTQYPEITHNTLPGLRIYHMK